MLLSYLRAGNGECVLCAQSCAVALYIIILLFETVVGSAKRPRLRLSGAAAEAPLGAFPRGYLGLW